MPKPALENALASVLPPGTDTRGPEVQRLLGEIPPSFWNGYNLAESPADKAGWEKLIVTWAQAYHPEYLPGCPR